MYVSSRIFLLRIYIKVEYFGTQLSKMLKASFCLFYVFLRVLNKFTFQNSTKMQKMENFTATWKKMYRRSIRLFGMGKLREWKSVSEKSLLEDHRKYLSDWIHELSHAQFRFNPTFSFFFVHSLWIAVLILVNVAFIFRFFSITNSLYSISSFNSTPPFLHLFYKIVVKLWKLILRTFHSPLNFKLKILSKRSVYN